MLGDAAVAAARHDRPGPKPYGNRLPGRRRANATAPLTTEPSCKDEMRVGQKNGLVYQWVKKGTRPRQPKDQRYANAYVFGAVCPARDAGAALVMPRADTEAMQKHLAEIPQRRGRRAGGADPRQGRLAYDRQA